MPTREAIVRYEDDWPWPGEPWPWCRWSKYRDYRKVSHAVPHDHHLVNGGNTWCPGEPGEIEVPWNDKYLLPKHYPVSLVTCTEILGKIISSMNNQQIYDYLHSFEFDNKHCYREHPQVYF